MKRIIEVLIIFLWASVLSAADHPNMLIVRVDDHACEAISAYGSFLKDYAKTPAIDKIADEGMRFEYTERSRFCPFLSFLGYDLFSCPLTLIFSARAKRE